MYREEKTMQERNVEIPFHSRCKFIQFSPRMDNGDHSSSLWFFLCLAHHSFLVWIWEQIWLDVSHRYMQHIYMWIYSHKFGIFEDVWVEGVDILLQACSQERYLGTTLLIPFDYRLALISVNLSTSGSIPQEISI